MACWRSSVDAADAKKAEVASVSALLKPLDVVKFNVKNRPQPRHERIVKLS